MGWSDEEKERIIEITKKKFVKSLKEDVLGLALAQSIHIKNSLLKETDTTKEEKEGFFYWLNKNIFIAIKRKKAFLEKVEWSDDEKKEIIEVAKKEFFESLEKQWTESAIKIWEEFLQKEDCTEKIKKILLNHQGGFSIYCEFAEKGILTEVEWSSQEKLIMREKAQGEIDFYSKQNGYETSIEKFQKFLKSFET